MYYIITQMYVHINNIDRIQSARGTGCQWRTQDFFSGGGSTNSIEDRENGDLGA